VPSNFPRQFWSTLRDWWREQVHTHGAASTASLLVRNLWCFVLDSTPESRRRRFGDMEYDWEHRVNTTSGTVGWRARLLGSFHSTYQPTEPDLFHEMMATLPIPFDTFTFVDLGSGKGRTLLMASEYAFWRIAGVELIAALHHAAQENIREYRSPTQRCRQIESILADAREFEFPDEPLVLYLFNPLPENALLEVCRRLEKSLRISPRPVYVIYHNPLLEDTLSKSAWLEKIGGTTQYTIYRAMRVGS
jgi:SAM-dependent methyltransferase